MAPNNAIKVTPSPAVFVFNLFIFSPINVLTFQNSQLAAGAKADVSSVQRKKTPSSVTRPSTASPLLGVSSHTPSSAPAHEYHHGNKLFSKQQEESVAVRPKSSLHLQRYSTNDKPTRQARFASSAVNYKVCQLTVCMLLCELFWN